MKINIFDGKFFPKDHILVIDAPESLELETTLHRERVDVVSKDAVLSLEHLGILSWKSTFPGVLKYVISENFVCSKSVKIVSVIIFWAQQALDVSDFHLIRKASEIANHELVLVTIESSETRVIKAQLIDNLTHLTFNSRFVHGELNRLFLKAD